MLLTYQTLLELYLEPSPIPASIFIYSSVPISVVLYSESFTPHETLRKV